MAWETGQQKLRREFADINQQLEEKEGYLDEGEAKLLLYKFLRENPSFACELFTGVKLFPFQHMAIKAMMESDYFLGIWSRGMSKSFSTGIFALLDAILHQGVQIGILSKSFRQSKMIFKKIEDLAKNGYKEITLLGQNIDAYGRDFQSQHQEESARITLSYLLKYIHDIEGI